MKLYLDCIDACVYCIKSTTLEGNESSYSSHICVPQTDLLRSCVIVQAFCDQIFYFIDSLIGKHLANALRDTQIMDFRVGLHRRQSLIDENDILWLRHEQVGHS